MRGHRRARAPGSAASEGFALLALLRVMMIRPTAEHEYSQCYVIPGVPLIRIAAALALRRRAGLGAVLGAGLGAGQKQPHVLEAGEPR